MKTIIFSQLSQEDQKKYFNFLLENDINFSQDENGNYLALIKILNPAFYSGDDQKANNTESKKLMTNSNISKHSKKEIDNIITKDSQNINNQSKKNNLKGKNKSVPKSKPNINISNDIQDNYFKAQKPSKNMKKSTKEDTEQNAKLKAIKAAQAVYKIYIIYS